MTIIECQKVEIMFINRASNGLNNICGANIAVTRKEMGLSQRQLADLAQLAGLDIDKNAIQRIEAGKRFITDIELITLSKILHKSYDELLKIRE